MITVDQITLCKATNVVCVDELAERNHPTALPFCSVRLLRITLLIVLALQLPKHSPHPSPTAFSCSMQMFSVEKRQKATDRTFPAELGISW